MSSGFQNWEFIGNLARMSSRKVGGEKYQRAEESVGLEVKVIRMYSF